ncbi:MAG: ankyrin repeat domain-containing protein [Hyphomicrobiaceae bacterium]
MRSLPSRPDIDQLKKQAKELLAEYRRGDPEAIKRFRTSLPAAAERDDEAIARLSLHLRDAQSCIAREYGFASWVDLKSFVDAVRAADAANSPSALAAAFARLAYAGDIAGGTNRARPNAAVRLLSEHPELAAQSPWIACAVGDLAVVRRRVEADPLWVNQPGGPLALPPLVATTHSGLLRLPEYKIRLQEMVDLLLAAGADPNQSVGSRWPPESVAAPSKDHMLSALYGAAGANHDPDLTRRLLTAGANPNDNESLYHSLEAPVCTRLLLEAGAVVTGTNALYRALDLDDLDTFRLLLLHAAGASELSGGRLLLWAIRRRRSPEHIRALLAAGVDPTVKTRDGVSAHTQALRYGLPEVAEVLKQAGVQENVADDDQFIAACARGDVDAARGIQARRPDLPSALSESQLRLLPELAAANCATAVRVMVELGWPIAVRGGDWSASALNQAVFRGDSALARFLLERGAAWTEEHGFGDNACGTLSWASLNQPVEDGDWVGCAAALADHGMPLGQRDRDDPTCVIVDGKSRQFSDDVSAFLLGEDADASRSL